MLTPSIDNFTLFSLTNNTRFLTFKNSKESFFEKLQKLKKKSKSFLTNLLNDRFVSAVVRRYIQHFKY